MLPLLLPLCVVSSNSYVLAVVSIVVPAHSKDGVFFLSNITDRDLQGSTREFEGVWDLYGNQLQPLAAYMPQQTTVGNHEKYYNYTSFRHRYKMPGEESGGHDNFFFSYDYGPVHFTSMCTEDIFSYAPGSPQYLWLEEDLAKAAANRHLQPWLVLLGHRPMYSSDTEMDSGDLRVDVEPLLKKYNVDLYGVSPAPMISFSLNLPHSLTHTQTR